jgi:cobyrinic acid a,c-diamide synthase
MGELGPRLVVAGTHSGVGKTTVATGLMAALRRRGVRVGAAKVGPDYIDPGYHALAVGRPSRNLDAWICGADAMPALAGRAARDTDVLVIEGVMGLFDGAADGTPSSTADLARQLDAPVLLVVDASSMSASVAAVVHGYASLDREVRVAGVILNRVGSPTHEELLREALEPVGLPVVGAIHRDDALGWRDRHLGLVPVVEQRAEVERALDRLAAAIDQSCDLDSIEKLASMAPTRQVGEPRLPDPVGSARIAVVGGQAFSFLYPDNLEALEAAGAELLPIDPARDAMLPDGCAGLIAGGGFPEVYAEALSANEPLLADLRERITRGLVVWAECGGLLWLARSLDGHPMAGVIDADATMADRLTLGYRSAVTKTESPLGPTGLLLRGHEFHYSTIEPAGDALEVWNRFGSAPQGFASPTLLASYLHLHLGNAPELATAFVQAAGFTPMPR